MKRVNVINESEMKVNLWMSTSEITSKNDRKKRKRRWIKEKHLVSNHSKWSFAYVKNDQRVTAMCWWCKVSHFCFWGVWIFQRTSKIVKRRRQYGGGHGNATQSGAYETNFKTIRLHSPTSSSYEEQNLSWGPTWHRKTPKIKKKKKNSCGAAEMSRNSAMDAENLEEVEDIYRKIDRLELRTAQLSIFNGEILNREGY